MKHAFPAILCTTLGHFTSYRTRNEAATKVREGKHCAFVASFLFFSACSAFAPTNIVHNATFDNDPWGWYFAGGGFGYQNGYLRVYSQCWQDLNTIPGHDYIVRFAWKESLPKLHWGDEVHDVFTNTSAASSWPHVYRFVRATTNVTRLLFENTGTATALDNILVGWLLEPAQILTQPQGRSAIDGGTVSFSVVADGGPPLRYQWFFDDQSVPGATNSFLVKTTVSPSDQGGYHVMVSNGANSVTSTVAQLTVDPQPNTPIIVLHPEGTTIATGYGYALRVVALGTPPLQYQWHLNNTEIENATNATLGFPSIQQTNEGTFFVTVSNSLGSVRSLPATLVIYQAAYEAAGVGVDTRASSSPVFDVDGFTSIDRSLYTAQLYLGASPTVLRPVGAPLTIFPAPFRGTITGTRSVPDVPPGEPAYGQIRVWETIAGSSYEEARGRGAKHGFSEVASVTVLPITGIAPKFPFKSFVLRYGVPFFTNGKLEAGEPQPNGLIQWTLVGEPGFRYLVEKGTSQNWAPLTILTNDTGRVSFIDPDQPNSSSSFYRSRILD